MGCEDFCEEDPTNIFMCIPDKMHRFFRIMTMKYLVNTQIKHYHIPFIIYFGYHPGASQKDVSSFLPFDKSRVSTVIHELMDMNIIVNESECKVSSIRLTENGKNLFAMCTMLQEIIRNALLSDLTEDEIRVFGNLVTKLDRKMDSMLEKTGDCRNS